LLSLSDHILLSALGLRNSWKILLPALGGLSAYALDSDLQLGFFNAQPDTRYLAAFIVLLFAGAFVSVRLPNSQAARKLVAGFTLATIVSVGGLLSVFTIGEVKDGLASKPIESEIAEGLKNWSLKPGAKVANLGLKEYYWARLARFKIVAEIPDAEAFWTARPENRTQVLEKIRDTGAQVIVLNPGFKIPDNAVREGWQEIGASGAYAYRF
jgi:hypothetical protein